MGDDATPQGNGTPPPQFPQRPADCTHEQPEFTVGGEVAKVYRGEVGDPERHLVGWALNIRGVRCDACGQRFKFRNLPMAGSLLEDLVMSPDSLSFHTPIQPDTRIIRPHKPKLALVGANALPLDQGQD